MNLLGKTVIYTPDEGEVKRINEMHNVNPFELGQTCAAIVVKVWDNGMVNLLVLLDGADSLWSTSISHGTGPGTYKHKEEVGITLGSLVKDKVTEFEGMVTGSADYIGGTRMLLVTNQYPKIHSEPVETWFNQSRLELIPTEG